MREGAGPLLPRGFGAGRNEGAGDRANPEFGGREGAGTGDQWIILKSRTHRALGKKLMIFFSRSPTPVFW
jgi:hypothetical protein